MLQAYLKYYSQLARGMKTEVIIYRKSGEGSYRKINRNRF